MSNQDIDHSAITMIDSTQNHNLPTSSNNTDIIDQNNTEKGGDQNVKKTLKEKWTDLDLRQFTKEKLAETPGGLKTIITSSYLNVMLVFVPLGIASNYVWSPTITFIMNFLAIVPLAKLLGFATEDISLRTGEVMGGLLNATFGNAVELIISILALSQNLVTVVQASMLGSILSNLMLVLGMCFWGGGYYHHTLKFNMAVAQTSASLLFISVASLLIPAAFNASISSDSSVSAGALTADILIISRATAIVLLILYFAYLFFQLRTHKELFVTEDGLTDMEEEEKEEPQLPYWMAITLLLVATAIIGVCSEFLVSAIESVTKLWHISEIFVGLILIPIVGNAAEHLTAVTAAVKNKMDLALGIAAGSSMQIALFVTPLTVIIGWGMGVEMSLYFNIYETAILFIAVILVNYLIVDGESNWLEGFMLCALYVVIAVSFYYYPDLPTAASSAASNNATSISAIALN